MSAASMLFAKQRQRSREASACSLALVLLVAFPASKGPSAADVALVRARKTLLSGFGARKEWRMTRKRKAGPTSLRAAPRP